MLGLRPRRSAGVTVTALLAVGVLSQAVAAPRPPFPVGAKRLSAGQLPRVCTTADDNAGASADASTYGYYYSKAANAWISAPFCYPGWGNLTASASQIVGAGRKATVTATPTDGSNSGQYAPETKSISWTYPGKRVAGCGSADLTCTVILAPRATREWQWGEFHVSMPRTFFIDSPGSNCAGQHLCAGATTNAWSFVGVPPKGTSAPSPPGLKAATAFSLDAVPVPAHSPGELLLRAKVTNQGSTRVRNARVSISLAPTFVTGTGRVMIDVGDLAKGQTKTVQRRVALRRVAVARGRTIAGLNQWTRSPGNWTGHPTALAFSGGHLIYSDSPEYIADTTLTGSGKAFADGSIEGVLYRQGPGVFANDGAPDFRVYLNHENRTTVAKRLFVVFVNMGAAGPFAMPAPPALITQGATGIHTKPGDPVGAGLIALGDWLHSTGQQKSLGPLAPGKALALPISDFKTKGTAEVVNAILDFTAAGGPLQVIVAAVNQTQSDAFAANPLSYHFNGDPSRLALTDPPLHNRGETHVAGTFAHHDLEVSLPAYDAGGGRPWGWLLATKNGDPGEYERAMDTGVANRGNYGVMYHITTPFTNTSDHAAELLFDPRGAGPVRDPVTGKVKVNNAFAGYTAVDNGTAFPVPYPEKNVKNPDLGIGVQPSQIFGSNPQLHLMPPGGSTLPLAVIVAPTYISAGATLTSSAGTVTNPKDLTVKLDP